LKAIAGPGFDPREVVYLPPEAKAFIAATNRTAAEILHVDFARQNVEIQIRSQTPCLLTVAQAYYHQWRAQVDDRPVLSATDASLKQGQAGVYALAIGQLGFDNVSVTTP